MFHRFSIALLCCLLFVAGGRAAEDSFDSDGVRIHYLIEGRGEPVLLIHGFATNAQLQWNLTGIMRALAKDYRVIAPDIRGHGNSGKPRGKDEYGTKMVEDVVRLLDRLKIGKAHVVGYSMGGLIVGKLLAAHPDRLLSATFVGVGPMAEEVNLPPFLEKLADSLEKGKGLAALFPTAAPGTLKLDNTTRQVLSRSLSGENGKVMATVVRSWPTLGVSEEKLKANKVPTLALIGAKDPYKETIDRVKNDMANLKVVVVNGVNHYNIVTNPKFIQNLRSFLKEQNSTPAKPNRGRKKTGVG